MQIETDYGLVYNDNDNLCVTIREDDIPFKGVKSIQIEEQTINYYSDFNSYLTQGSPTVTPVNDGIQGHFIIEGVNGDRFAWSGCGFTFNDQTLTGSFRYKIIEGDKTFITPYFCLDGTTSGINVSMFNSQTSSYDDIIYAITVDLNGTETHDINLGFLISENVKIEVWQPQIEQKTFPTSFTDNPQMALDFDGTNDKVVVPDNTDFDFTAFTVEAWVFSNSTQTSYANIIDKSHDSISGWAFEYTLDGTQIYFTLGANSVVASTNINDGKWHHIAGVYDGTTSYIYIDGNLEASADYAFNNSSGELYFGTWKDTGTRWFNGKIKNVRIWNKALTSEEVEISMKRKKLSGTEDGLVAYYKFNEGSGTVLHDYAGSNNGTIYSATWTDGRPNGILQFQNKIDFTKQVFQMWFKINEITNAFPRILDVANGTTGLEAHLGIYYNNSAQKFYFATSNSKVQIDYTNTNLTGKWFFAVLLLDDGNNAFYIYDDNGFVDKKTLIATPPDLSQNTIKFGECGTGTRTLNGFISNLLIAEYEPNVWTDDYIRKLYENQKPFQV